MLGSADREHSIVSECSHTAPDSEAIVLHPGGFSRAGREFVEEHEERFCGPGVRVQRR